MSILFILCIVFGCLAVAAFVIMFMLPDYPSWRPALVGALAGVFIITALILGVAGSQVITDDYNYETVHICTEKGGIVSKDNHCFVNNRPVQFAPGVYQR